jgi:hypothetical protein
MASRRRKRRGSCSPETVVRDKPSERLDLPNDPAHRDPTGYRAERRAFSAPEESGHDRNRQPRRRGALHKGERRHFLARLVAA